MGSPAEAAASFAVRRYRLHLQARGEVFARQWLARLDTTKLFSFLVTDAERQEALDLVRSHIAG